MKSCEKLLRIAVVLAGLVVCSPGGVQAQARAAAAALGSAGAAPAPPQPSKSDNRADDDSSPMGWASIGIKVGLAGNSVARLPADEESTSFPDAINARRGMRIAFPIHIGGKGFGWTVEPYLSRSRVRRLARDTYGDVEASPVAYLTAFGVYTGPCVQLQLARPLYLGIGFGAMSSYIESPGFDYGVDLYGRLPLSLTYYVSNQFALMAEFGVGYGVSLFANKVRTATDRSTGQTSLVKDSADLGQAFAWDWSFGIRLP